MEDLNAARAAMEQKTARKRELINTLKGMNAKLIELRDTLNKLQPAAPARRTPTQRLIEKAEHMEFVIGTSAYTPAQERAMLKELKLVQAQIGQAAAVNKVSDEVNVHRTALREQLALRAPVQAELDTLRSELEVLYQTILKAGAERAAMHREREDHGEMRDRRPREGRRPAGAGRPRPGGDQGERRGGFNDERRRMREEERAEMAPYMKEVDPFVSLEEIAEIKKKPARPSE